MTHQHQNRKRGFTLIEMLVVVAIICLLAAILFPVFARARENARRASCMSNLKQIGMGVMQYVQDYDEHYPIAWYGYKPDDHAVSYKQETPGTPGAKFKTYGATSSTTKGNWITWMDMIYPYVKSVQVFQCPSFNTNATSSEVREGLQYQMNGAYSNTTLSTYATSNEVAYATYQYGKTILHTGTPVSAILRPAETIMTFEARGIYCAYGLQGVASLLPGNGQKALEPHLGGMNLAFGDGHVKWMSSSQILAQTGTSTGVCDLGFAANSLYGYPSRSLCSKLWNPFLS